MKSRGKRMSCPKFELLSPNWANQTMICQLARHHFSVILVKSSSWRKFTSKSIERRMNQNPNAKHAVPFRFLENFKSLKNKWFMDQKLLIQRSLSNWRITLGECFIFITRGGRPLNWNTTLPRLSVVPLFTGWNQSFRFTKGDEGRNQFPAKFQNLVPIITTKLWPLALTAQNSNQARFTQWRLVSGLKEKGSFRNRSHKNLLEISLQLKTQRVRLRQQLISY